MKKTITFLLALILMFILVACGPAPTGFAEEYSAEDGGAPITLASSTSNNFTVEKHPTSEVVEAGGKAKFIAYASTPASIKWYFINPMGNMVYSASELHSAFPYLVIEGHNTQTLTLSNIPAALNGYGIYAVLTAPSGESLQSNTAMLVVNSPSIKITKHPYDENNVVVGTSTSFIAHADNATSVVWYATKGDKTLLASELSAYECPGVEIYDYDKDHIIIRNAPWSISGWSFFACFDGENGPAYTNKAIITIIAQPTPKCEPCWPICPPCPPIYIEPQHPCNPHPCNPCAPCGYVEPTPIVITADLCPSSVAPVVTETIVTTTVTTTTTQVTQPITPPTPHAMSCCYICP